MHLNEKISMFKGKCIEKDASQLLQANKEAQNSL